MADYDGGSGAVGGIGWWEVELGGEFKVAREKGDVLWGCGGHYV
jgi:hypothetical protein